MTDPLIYSKVIDVTMTIKVLTTRQVKPDTILLTNCDDMNRKMSRRGDALRRLGAVDWLLKFTSSVTGQVDTF